jgi:competence protein CoiA
LEEEVEMLRGQDFYCPACEGEVKLKAGPVVRAYFAHVTLADCAQVWAENESAQHLGLKAALYRWFQKSREGMLVEVERYLPELSQTPDLLVNGRLAIEIQCSRLSVARLRERTRTYRKHGYAVLWLLGRDLWLDKRLTPLLREMLYFSENAGFYLWELDLARGELRLKSLIHEHLRGTIACMVRSVKFDSVDLMTVLRSPYAAQPLTRLPVKSDKDFQAYLTQQLHYQNPRWMKIQENYYRAGENLLTVDLTGLQWTPVGLNPLSVKFDGLPEGQFLQIPMSVRSYYQDFLRYNQTATTAVYPPAFYRDYFANEKSKL